MNRLRESMKWYKLLWLAAVNYEELPFKATVFACNKVHNDADLISVNFPTVGGSGQQLSVLYRDANLHQFGKSIIIAVPLAKQSKREFLLVN